MKSYTDLEQSKKLAEILPLESADFVWLTGHLHTDGPRYEVIRTRNEVSEPENYWPCWSLAALLSILPSVITRNDKRMFLTMEKAGAYNLYYKSPDRLDELWETDFEPIDVCYKIILDLHEQKLL